MPKKKVTKKKKPQKNGVEVWIPPKHLLETRKGKAPTIAEQVVDAELIMDACNNDAFTAQFFLLWLQNGNNATEAYRSLKPHVTHHSATVLGARELAKVSKSAIMEAYGLGYASYFRQLRAGMEATKIVGLQGDEVDDHKTRRLYHEAQGKILGIEQKEQLGTPSQVNVATAINNWIVTDKPQEK